MQQYNGTKKINFHLTSFCFFLTEIFFSFFLRMSQMEPGVFRSQRNQTNLSKNQVKNICQFKIHDTQDIHPISKFKFGNDQLYKGQKNVLRVSTSLVLPWQHLISEYCNVDFTDYSPLSGGGGGFSYRPSRRGNNLRLSVKSDVCCRYQMAAQQDIEIIAVKSHHKFCYLGINNLTTHFHLNWQ